MKAKLYQFENRLFVCETAASAGELVGRPWPLDESGRVEFIPTDFSVFVGEVELKTATPQGNPNQVQGKSKASPSHAQDKPKANPALEPIAANQNTSKPYEATAYARSFKPNFDVLRHYYDNASFVAAILEPATYARCEQVKCFDDLKKVNKFPYPAMVELNNRFGFFKKIDGKTKTVDKRNFYMNLAEIHSALEAYKLPAWVRFTDRLVITFCQKFFSA